MGVSRGDDALPMLEMSCPEFYVSHIGRIESAGGDNLRLYMCVKRGNALEPVYSVVIPIDILASMARQCQHAVAHAHNELQFLLGGVKTEH